MSAFESREDIARRCQKFMVHNHAARERNRIYGIALLIGAPMENPMKILQIAVVTVLGFASALPAGAADLNIERPTYYSRHSRERVVVSPAPIWNPNRPADILYTGIGAYPGWHGDPAYIRCRTARAREIMPDGTVVISRVSAC